MISRLGLAGGGVALATTGVYVAVILREGNNTPAEFVPWAAAFGVIGVAAAAASFAAAGTARALTFAGTAGTAFALGLLGLWSIGILLLAVAALLMAASRESWPGEDTALRRTLASTAAAAVIALAVLISIL